MFLGLGDFFGGRRFLDFFWVRDLFWLGEKSVEGKRKIRKRKNNAKFSGHYVCPRTETVREHTLRSHQNQSYTNKVIIMKMKCNLVNLTLFFQAFSIILKRAYTGICVITTFTLHKLLFRALGPMCRLHKIVCKVKTK